MFAADGNTIPNDTSTRDYLAAMPAVATEALQLLATAGKFIVKNIAIAHIPVNNLIPSGDKIYNLVRGEMKFEALGARSLVFDFCGDIEYVIEVDGNVVKYETVENATGYERVKELVSNPDDKQVTLTIKSKYPFSIMNIGMYEADYKEADSIPAFTEKIRYDLKKLTNDFYMLSDEGIVFEGDSTTSRYETTDNYLQEGNTVLVLDRNIKGNFTVYYKAYPQEITAETGDDDILAIDPEVAALMPLYMASQLYKDDDNGIATQYRNEFEVGFERLRDSAKTPSAEHFTSESGWV